MKYWVSVQILSLGTCLNMLSTKLKQEWCTSKVYEFQNADLNSKITKLKVTLSYTRAIAWG